MSANNYPFATVILVVLLHLFCRHGLLREHFCFRGSTMQTARDGSDYDGWYSSWTSLHGFVLRSRSLVAPRWLPENISHCLQGSTWHTARDESDHVRVTLRAVRLYSSHRQLVFACTSVRTGLQAIRSFSLWTVSLSGDVSQMAWQRPVQCLL